MELLKYWGKAESSQENGPEDNRWHPLVCHSLDVAAVCQAYLEENRTFSDFWADRLGLESAQFRDFSCFWAGLHDLGKFGRDFQVKIPELYPAFLGENPPFRFPKGHPDAAWFVWEKWLKPSIYSRFNTKENLTGRPRSFTRVTDPLLTASFGHHGVPTEKNDNQADTFEACFPEDPTKNHIQTYLEDLLSLYPGSGQVFSEPDQVVAKPADWKAFSFALSGLIVLADWTASSSRNFPYICRWGEFPPDDFSLRDYFATSADLAGQALERQGLAGVSMGETGSDAWTALFPDFAAKGFSPTPLQQAALSRKQGEEPGLYILEDAAGAGKTEAALLLIQKFLGQAGANGFYFALPTMATSNGIYNRLSELYTRFYTPESKPSLVLAHSSSKLQENYQRSIVPENPVGENFQIGGEGVGPGQGQVAGFTNSPAAIREWLADKSKKAFLAQVGVGSIDQALLATIFSRHFSLRMFGLSQKVLVVDEVHAYDTYMQEILRNLLIYMGTQGRPVILLSATLPVHQKNQLAEAYLEGRGIAIPDETDNGTDGKQVPYPLMTVISRKAGEAHREEIPVAARPENIREIAVEFRHDFDQVIQEIAELAGQGECVVWIRNTVGDVQEGFEALAKNIAPDKLMMFHSRFALTDRQKKEEEVLGLFGKTSGQDQRAGRVLVASQVVEQSLDLDFDEMFTDLCPVDLVIQRSGRLKRHKRDNVGNPTTENEERSQPVLRVFGPEIPVEQGDVPPAWYSDFFPNGAGFVYPNFGQLWRTAVVLRSLGKIRIPDDSRYLVEEVYGPDGPAIPPALIRATQKAEQEAMENIGLARHNTIDVEAGYVVGSNLEAWPEETAPTRLGPETKTWRLAVWDGAQIRPWAGGEIHAWGRSEVKNRPYNISYPAYMEEKIKETQRQMPDRGRGGDLLVLKEIEGQAGWFVCAGSVEGRGDLYYSREQGLVRKK